jgi:hypothetical protein
MKKKVSVAKKGNKKVVKASAVPPAGPALSAYKSGGKMGKCKGGC